MLPAPPQTIEEMGIPPSVVTDLALRRLLLDGISSIANLSRALHLSMGAANQVFQRLRQQQWIEVKGMIGNDYQFLLTVSGKQLATERFQLSQYAGAAPVSLTDYQTVIRQQAARVEISRISLREAFRDLVVPDSLLDQLGPALISQSSIFLYGSSGNGKTSIAERLLRVYSDTIQVPHALEVDGQIISIFDPVVHNSAESVFDQGDPRWVRCRRPCVITGGELVSSMLELHLDETSGIYSAPLQMKANNGIFIIDDFGRQLISPRDLLNRWIVPLDRRVDYLTLRYGVKFQVPFEVMVVFSTNLDPKDLADEAFLRRIRNKIEVPPVQDTLFSRIFDRELERRHIEPGDGSGMALAKLCRDHGSGILRACYPSDILNIVEAISRYESRPPDAKLETIERAVDLYFSRQA